MRADFIVSHLRHADHQMPRKTGSRRQPGTQPSDGVPVYQSDTRGIKPSGSDSIRRYHRRVVASNVSAYSWYVDRSGFYPTVVVSITVTIPSYNATYSASQTLRFYPRVTATPSP